MFHLEKLDLGDLEAQFGLMVREKKNHNNYALFRFKDLEKIVNYYDSFKKETRKYTVSNSKQNPMTHLKIMLDSDKEFLETIFSKMNSGKTKYSLKELSSRADFFRTRIQKIEKLIKELEDQK